MIDKERHRWQARCYQMTGDLANIIEECFSTYNYMTNFWAFEFQTVVCGKNSLSNCGGDSCCCISQNHIVIFFQFYFKLILSSLHLWLPLNYTGKFKEKKKNFHHEKTIVMQMGNRLTQQVQFQDNYFHDPYYMQTSLLFTFRLLCYN